MMIIVNRLYYIFSLVSRLMSKLPGAFLKFKWLNLWASYVRLSFIKMHGCLIVPEIIDYILFVYGSGGHK